MKMHFGVQLWPQNTTWDSLESHAKLVDRLGYDSLWTWDHFVPIAGGDVYGAQLGCWEILCAWAAITKNVRLGALVSGNTYRHPAVLAKMATTLDHISRGRAILGLGAAWMEFEHRAYGISFDTAGVRLAKLAESARIIRSLLDHPRTTVHGKHYDVTDAPSEPKPIQARLPIMIGGGGERKTLRVAARYADMWHGFGTPEVIAHKVEVLRKHCVDVGRDPAEIMPASGGSVHLGRGDVAKRLDAVAKAQGIQRSTMTTPITGSAEAVAERVAEYWRAGARGFIVGVSAPHDGETIERFATEVRPLVEQLIA